MIGRHVFGQPIEPRLLAVSYMEGDTFMLIINFDGSAVIAYPYLTTYVGIRNRVIVLVVGKLNGIILLHGHLFAFLYLVRFTRKGLQNGLFLSQENIPPALGAVLIRLLIECIQVDPDMMV